MLLSSYYDTCKAESIKNQIHDSRYRETPALDALEALVIKNSYS